MKPKEKTIMNVVAFLLIINLCCPLVVGAQHAILDAFKKLRNSEDKAEENRIGTEDAFCPKKCTCTGYPDNSVKCSGLTTKDLTPGMFSGDQFTKIDLRQNSLDAIPSEAFQNLSNLRELILTDNALTDVPNDVLQIVGHQLSSIDLSRNKISALKSNAFQHCPMLTSIDLSNNQISTIEEGTFKKLSSLQKLVIQSNSLTYLEPTAFEDAANIRLLDLQSNRLTEVPIAIQHLPFLQELDLSRNQIEIIPENLFQKCQQLEQIELKRNPIKHFHVDSFAHLPQLKKLIVSEARDVTIFPNLNGTFSLNLLRIDRSKLEIVPNNLCIFCPNLKSLELKSNKITELPNLTECQDLRLLDLARNQITALKSEEGKGPFEGLTKLHDLILHNNNISIIDKFTFRGLKSLQVLDLMANKIEDIDDEAFVELKKLEDINLGMNTFSKFPSKGLKNVIHIKTHNNPNLKEFPGSGRFPKVQNLVLSYAYHCCQFIPSTYENLIPEYADFGNLKETIFYPGEGEGFDQSLWNSNDSSAFWSKAGAKNQSEFSAEVWENYGLAHGSHLYDEKSLMFATPPPGIQCMPAPGTFLPCNDLFDWWTLRCSVWIVFLLALLGNGCVVIVLVSSRGKMDVPRFLVCNLAAADFFMGLYLGFLAVVDASTLGEFRRYAISWQFSTGCQAAGFFGVLSSELSVFTLAVITLERNYAITHAMHLNKRLSLRHAAYIMVAGWTFALLMATMPLVGVSDYRKFAVCLPFETGDGLSLGFVIFLTLINGVGFIILMGCYLKMYCAIRGSQAWNSNDSRIAKRMALLVFTDFICWFPIAFFALTSCFGVHLISLDQAKVFTVFVLPLNSCFNPFLYAILTKQFKKDCVMICKAIEESRVTRGIGRCRHSSNFSNRQTPANTNSLNSGSGTHGSHGAAVPGGHPVKGNVCNCNIKKHNKPTAGTILVSRWPFNKLKKIFLGYKDANEMGGGLATSGSEYAQQIADIQHKQKTKRHASLSSENFSSSRSDSWRIHGGHHPQCLQQQHLNHGRGRGVVNGVGAAGAGPHDHRRRNSWTVTRKPSQDSQLSSSRNDSNSSSNSTQTWRMSRSSVSSEMGNSRPGSGYGNKGGNVPANAPIDPTTGKLNMSMVHNQRINGGIMKGRAPPLARLASENSANQMKPKLIRQTAILADGDSTGSSKSVKFQEPPIPGYVVVGGARRFITAAAEVGACPLHSHEKYKALYEKLAESSHDESDMEPSDADSDDGHAGGQQQSVPMHHAPPPPPTSHSAMSGNPIFMHRKLSTISSKDRDSKEEMTSPDSGATPQHEMVFSATADVIASCDPQVTSPTTIEPSSRYRDAFDKPASTLKNSHSIEENPSASPGPSLPVRSSSENTLAAATATTSDLLPAKVVVIEEEDQSALAAAMISEDQEQSQSLLGHKPAPKTGRDVHIKRFLNTDV